METCKSDIDNEVFMMWLSNKVGKKYSRVTKWVEDFIKESPEKRGRKSLSEEDKQAVCDMWHDYSIVTVDRRQNRNQVYMKHDDYQEKMENFPFQRKLM